MGALWSCAAFLVPLLAYGGVEREIYARRFDEILTVIDDLDRKKTTSHLRWTIAFRLDDPAAGILRSSCVILSLEFGDRGAPSLVWRPDNDNPEVWHLRALIGVPFAVEVSPTGDVEVVDLPDVQNNVRRRIEADAESGSLEDEEIEKRKQSVESRVSNRLLSYLVGGLRLPVEPSDQLRLSRFHDLVLSSPVCGGIELETSTESLAPDMEFVQWKKDLERRMDYAYLTRDGKLTVSVTGMSVQGVAKVSSQSGCINVLSVRSMGEGTRDKSDGESRSCGFLHMLEVDPIEVPEGIRWR